MAKTDPNHKASFSHGVKVNCSCGWASSTHWGKGAQAQASWEWQQHKKHCIQTAA